MKQSCIKTILPSIIALAVWSNAATAQRIAAGGWHSVVVCSDGTVKAFGENASGQLGDGSTTDRSSPVSVSGLSDIIAVSAGGDQLEAHSLALKSDGTVWGWGSNLYGALGNGSTTNTTAPVQATGLTNAIAISAGGWHSAALKADGTVWTWGWNVDGQLGDGTMTDRSTPAQVSGLSGITAIAAGTYHVLALKNDGTVWAWGDNVSGQIGDGSTNDRTTPVQVSGLTGVIKIAAGRFFSLAVKSDGTVWTWGENLYGQLGDGTMTDRTTPVQVTGLTGITSATAATGAFHCMAEKSDNTVWAWGRNTYGNLGDNTIVHRSTPVQMIGISSVAGMAAGTNFSLVYKDDGTFWGCGRNASGQLGDGTVLQRNTLTQSTLVCPIILVPTGISTQNGSNFLKVTTYPNPSADGKFTVQFPDVTLQNSGGVLEVHNWTGRKILQLPIDLRNSNSPVFIDLSRQATGVYLLTVSACGQRISQKLIKN